MKHKFLSDLNWVCQSPFLMDHDFSCEGIDTFDTTPDLPDDWQSMEKGRIGHYFEWLHQYAMKLRGFDVLAYNLQVQVEGRTLGEFDMIYRMGDAIIHRELAVKFYISRESQSAWNTWHGPNGKDRLDLKMDKLLNSQLCLSDQPEAKAFLQSKDIPEITHRELFIKGRFFYHWSDWISESCTFPDQAAEGHLKGWWIDKNNLSELPMADYVILERSEWLGSGAEKKHMISYLELEDHFATIERAVLLVRLNDYGAEIDRGFVIV
ncbi:MAG: DUF1853 family protein [Lentisphaeria bacterium]|nr:DUF1853 family protein [Lentisphaeria bacterium]NQZ67355.1 DUF1853 family protein [Lentisphaeria bacterium]